MGAKSESNITTATTTTKDRALEAVESSPYLIRLKCSLKASETVGIRRKKVTLKQITHRLPVLIGEFLFPRFYSFALCTLLVASLFFFF